MEKETGIESKSPGPLRDERGQSLIVMLLLLVPVLVLVIGLVYDLVLFHKTTLDFLALRRLKRWALFASEQSYVRQSSRRGLSLSKDGCERVPGARPAKVALRQAQAST